MSVAYRNKQGFVSVDVWNHIDKKPIKVSKHIKISSQNYSSQNIDRYFFLVDDYENVHKSIHGMLKPYKRSDRKRSQMYYFNYKRLIEFIKANYSPVMGVAVVDKFNKVYSF